MSVWRAAAAQNAVETDHKQARGCGKVSLSAAPFFFCIVVNRECGKQLEQVEHVG